MAEPSANPPDRRIRTDARASLLLSPRFILVVRALCRRRGVRGAQAAEIRRFQDFDDALLHRPSGRFVAPLPPPHFDTDKVKIFHQLARTARFYSTLRLTLRRRIQVCRWGCWWEDWQPLAGSSGGPSSKSTNLNPPQFNPPGGLRSSVPKPAEKNCWRTPPKPSSKPLPTAGGKTPSLASKPLLLFARIVPTFVS